MSEPSRLRSESAGWGERGAVAALMASLLAAHCSPSLLAAQSCSLLAVRCSLLAARRSLLARLLPCCRTILQRYVQQNRALAVLLDSQATWPAKRDLRFLSLTAARLFRVLGQGECERLPKTDFAAHRGCALGARFAQGMLRQLAWATAPPVLYRRMARSTARLNRPSAKRSRRLRHRAGGVGHAHQRKVAIVASSWMKVDAARGASRANAVAQRASRPLPLGRHPVFNDADEAEGMRLRCLTGRRRPLVHSRARRFPADWTRAPRQCCRMRASSRVYTFRGAGVHRLPHHEYVEGVTPPSCCIVTPTVSH